MHVATPFLGAEALGCGALNRHQLRTRCRRLFPGVYLGKDVEPTVDNTVVAAWLWSHRVAVAAGLAAAVLLGSKWVPIDVTVDLICRNTRPPQGIRCRNDSLLDGEVAAVRGMRVTTAERTAFDLARRGPIGTAVARVDALMSATGIAPADVALVAARHPGSPGLRQFETVLALVDGGAESPKETWLRLLLVNDGFPAPRTQIEVFDGDYLVARLDMGWPELMVAVEYDGDQHRTDRRQYVRDVRRLEQLNRLGWIVVRVVKEDSPRQVVCRVREAVAFRGSRLSDGRDFGPNPAQVSVSAHVNAV